MRITITAAVIYIIFYPFLSPKAKKRFWVFWLMIGGYELILLFHNMLIHWDLF